MEIGFHSLVGTPAKTNKHQQKHRNTRGNEKLPGGMRNYQGER